MAWKIAHEVLPVQYFFYSKGITSNLACTFCGNAETLGHLFCKCPHVGNLWLYVEMLLSKMAQCHVVLSNQLILFNITPKNFSKKLRNILLYLVNEAKFVIYKCRCDNKYNQNVYTPDSIVALMKYRILSRLKADFYRLPRIVFVKVWCHNNALCKMSGDKYVPKI